MQKFQAWEGVKKERPSSKTPAAVETETNEYGEVGLSPIETTMRSRTDVNNAQAKYVLSRKPNIGCPPQFKGLDKFDPTGTGTNQYLTSLKLMEKGLNDPTVLCYVITTSAEHGPSGKARAVHQTWGQQCDKLLLISDKEDSSIGAITVNMPNGNADTYDNLWMKNQAAQKYVFAEYGRKFDYFLKADDNSFIIMENLKGYLRSAPIANQNDLGKPLLLGRRWHNGGIVWISGGAGYLLNNPALELVVKSIGEDYCTGHVKGEPEDRLTAMCLAHHHVTPVDTRDNIGAERFLAFTPGNNVHYRIAQYKGFWYNDFSFDLKDYPGCCSKEVISFHYVDAKLMLALDDALHHCKVKNT